MSNRHRFITILVAVVAVTLLLATVVPAVFAQVLPSKTVATGQTWEVTETTYLSVLVVEEGAIVKAADGFALTMTVNGVETGQALVTTAGFDTAIQPGLYQGRVVLTVCEESLVPYSAPGPPGPPLAFPFRQAVYVDADGVDWSKSVPAAVSAGAVTHTFADHVQLISTGENFTGFHVVGGSYTITDAMIDFAGNGRSDFIGTGAAIVATGGSRLVVDGATITNTGSARAGVVADGGANVLVKNSHIETYDGVLPADYVPTIDTSQMRSVPWMLALSGNVRATNLLGTDTKATYVNSYIASEGWGVLSTDGCTTPTLTAINSTIEITGDYGYGSYGIGDATEYFLGCEMNVATYATISRGSFLFYGDSDKAKVADLNETLDLGLTEAELAALPARPTVVNSDKFGIMWHGGGTLDVSGGTVFNTGKTTFLDKGQAITIRVDGSEGAKLNPGNGVIMQLMDDDDPGPNFADMTNTNTYTEPTTPPAKATDFDVTTVNSGDAVATFANIVLVGDFFNSSKGGSSLLAAADDGEPVNLFTPVPTDGEDPGAGDPGAADPGAGDPGAGGAPSGGGPGGPGGPPPGVGGAPGQNLVLNFENSSVTGTISASSAHHYMLDPGVFTIGADEYYKLGEVTNTPGPAVNNGVLVSLTKGSKWTVTQTSYLTRLTIEPGSSIEAAPGMTLSIRVNGKAILQKAGSYTGEIVLEVKPLSVFGGTSLRTLLGPATD